jgi:hypothetical protein
MTTTEAPAPDAAPDPRTRRAREAARYWNTLAWCVLLVLIGFTLGYWAAHIEPPTHTITTDTPTAP